MKTYILAEMWKSITAKLRNNFAWF